MDRSASAGRAGRGRFRRRDCPRRARARCRTRAGSRCRPAVAGGQELQGSRGRARRSRCSAASKCGCQTLHACSACAVMSGVLRSNGSVPQPRQNVGMPPSRFWRPSNQRAPAAAAAPSADPDRRAAATPGARPACRPRRARRRAGRPGPAARRRVGERMLPRVLLAEQPVPHRPAFAGRQRAGLGQRFDRQRRHPRRQVRVDRPAAVGAHRLDEEPHALFRRPGCRPGPCRQAHHHEAGQRRRFQEAAARRLDGAQQARRRGANPSSQRAGRADSTTARSDAAPGRWRSAPAARS